MLDLVASDAFFLYPVRHPPLRPVQDEARRDGGEKRPARPGDHEAGGRGGEVVVVLDGAVSQYGSSSYCSICLCPSSFLRIVIKNLFFSLS